MCLDWAIGNHRLSSRELLRRWSHRHGHLCCGDLHGGFSKYLYELWRINISIKLRTKLLHRMLSRELLCINGANISLGIMRFGNLLCCVSKCVHKLRIGKHRSRDRDDGLHRMRSWLLPSKHGSKLVHGLPRLLLLLH